jgi:DNA repair photolyase
MTPKITMGTKEWADYNINCFKGCSNDCRYCYAKLMAKRFGRATEKTWKEMSVRKEVLYKNFHRYKGRVMFPSSHDIIDKPEVVEVCLTVLANLLDPGNEVLVTSKPCFNVIKEIISRFSDYKNNMQFRFTITSNDEKLLSFWEPNAPKYKERLECLKLAFRNGFKTSISIEPFLDITPVPLVYELSSMVTESIWIGPMNYIPRKNIDKRDFPYYDRVRKNRCVENLRKIYDELVNFPKIRFKDSMLIKLGLL